MNNEENSNKIEDLGKDDFAASCFKTDLHADIGERIYLRGIYLRGICNSLAKKALSACESCASRFDIFLEVSFRNLTAELNWYSNYLAKFKNCCKPISLPESLRDLSMVVPRAVDAASKAQHRFKEFCYNELRELYHILRTLYSVSKRATKDLLSEDDFKKDSGELEGESENAL